MDGEGMPFRRVLFTTNQITTFGFDLPPTAEMGMDDSTKGGVGNTRNTILMSTRRREESNAATGGEGGEGGYLPGIIKMQMQENDV